MDPKPLIDLINIMEDVIETIEKELKSIRTEIRTLREDLIEVTKILNNKPLT